MLVLWFDSNVRSWCFRSGITFGPLSAHEIKDLSEVDILSTILYEYDSKKPQKHGLLDLRLVSLRFFRGYNFHSGYPVSFTDYTLEFIVKYCFWATKTSHISSSNHCRLLPQIKTMSCFRASHLKIQIVRHVAKVGQTALVILEALSWACLVSIQDSSRTLSTYSNAYAR